MSSVLSSEDNIGASDASVQISKENILADMGDVSSVDDPETQRKLEANEEDNIANDLATGEKPPDEENNFPDHASSKHSEFPDGGLNAWLTVVGGFFCLFCSFGFINAVGVFQTYYQQNQLSNRSAFQIGWLSSFLVFFMNMGGIIVGPLFDIFGPRWLLLAGTILSSFGLMMTSLCKEYWQFFLAQGIVVGAGLSLIFQTAVLCINTWFLKRRGLAIGLVVSGSSLGGVCFPIMLRRLFVSIGFGWAVRAAGFLILVCLIIANFLVRSRLSPPGWTKRRQICDLNALKEPVYCVAIAASCFVYWGLFTPFTFLTTYAETYGMDDNLAFYLISFINIASIVGRIVPGILADQFGVYNVQFVSTVIMGISILGFWTPSRNEASIIAFGAFYGFVSGAYISLFTVCIAMISPIEKIGGRMGLLCGFTGIAALTGIPISGALLTPGKWSNGFGPMILFSGFACLTGGFLYGTARVMMVGWKLKVKR